MEVGLQKRSNLVMPTIGYELDREEMSYVDGGASLVYSKFMFWNVAVGGSFSKSECDDLAYIFNQIAAGITIVGGIATLISLKLNPAVGGIVGAVSAIVAGSAWWYANIFAKGSQRNGCILYFIPYTYKIL